MKWMIQALLVAAVAVFWVLVELPDDKLHLVFCDVGQGDSELIVKGRVQILIDTGPGDSKVMECLDNNIPFWDRQLEMVVVTHPQKDHMGGLDEVLRNYDVKRIVANGAIGEGGDWAEIVAMVKAREIEVFVPEAGDVFRFGDVSLQVLWPVKEVGQALAWRGVESNVLGAYSDVNEISIVMRLEFGQFTAMFTGDLGEKEEQALVGMGVITPVEVLKVPHHGSKYSSSEEFVRALKPSLAVVEVGKNNSYGHPSSITTDRFDTVGSKVLRTDINGEVDVISDGEKWWVE